MKGMAKLVTWSIVDETQHTEGMIELFKVFVEENKNWRSTNKAIMFYKKRCIKIAKEMVGFRRSVYRSCF